MLDQTKLQEYLDRYKENFTARFEGGNHDGERVKWEAVQWFQENWRDDADAEEFPVMLQGALLQTGDLLAAAPSFPRSRIQSLAQTRPEEVQAMFRDLFQEGRDVIGRIADFRERADKLQQEVGEVDRNHDQTETAITTYLWLRYPDRYGIYRYEETRALAEVLGTGYVLRKKAAGDNLRAFLALYDEVNAQLAEDEELVALFRDHLDWKCYPDPSLRTLTVDFCFFVGGLEAGRKAAPGVWIQPEYTPGFTVEEWKRFLKDSSLFTPASLKAMKRLLDSGGEASCVQLARRYGESTGFYSVNISRLGRRILQQTGCPAPEPDSSGKNWWLLSVQGRTARREERGAFIFRIRPELKEALEQTDLSGIALYEQRTEGGNAEQNPPPQKPENRFWWLTLPGGKVLWSLAEDAESPMERRRGEMPRDGEPVMVCVAGEVPAITALARVTGDPEGAGRFVEKTEELSVPLDAEEAKKHLTAETAEAVCRRGTMQPLTEQEYGDLLERIRRENPLPAEVRPASYTKEDFLAEVFLEEADYDRLTRLLETRKNIILQGAPGVGKTFAARRLAYAMMGERDEERVEFVQFHQNYAYEDFVIGYKPDGEGFHLRQGVFCRFCRKAARHPEQKFFFLIDEVNRGNLSRIFGELLMLIERDYRDTSITLSADGQPFCVPGNVYLIGMMNTADRSLALIDYALRRRFSFVEMEPGFTTPGFVAYRESLHSGQLDALVDAVRQLNQEIAEDPSLGRGCRIGHSYFCGCTECTREWLESIVLCDIVPTLQEYWFDRPEQAEKWEDALLEALT